jgi:hypothetical protein
MEAYWGLDVEFKVFLTSALVGGEWSASFPGRVTSGERGPDIHWKDGWVGPIPGLDDVESELMTFAFCVCVCVCVCDNSPSPSWRNFSTP